MAGAKKIQDDSADLKFALEATKKALEEIEARRRQKRKMRREKREGGDGEEDEVEDDEELEAVMDDKGRVCPLILRKTLSLNPPFEDDL